MEKTKVNKHKKLWASLYITLGIGGLILGHHADLLTYQIFPAMLILSYGLVRI